MAGGENEAQEIVADVVVNRSVKFGHCGLPMRFEFAAQLFVLAFEHRAAPEVIDGAMFGRGHEPSAGIIRHAGARPLFESGDQRILRELFCDAHIAHDAREPGDHFGGFHAPNGVNRRVGLAEPVVGRFARGSGMRFGSRHGSPITPSSTCAHKTRVVYPTRWHSRSLYSPRAAASILAMSIFFMVNIACAARLARAGSGSLRALINCLGTICQATP